MSQTKAKQKVNNFARLKDLFKFARKYYAPMIISIILLIGSAVFAILTPRYVQNLTNLISPAELVVGTDGVVHVKMDSFVQNAVTLLCFIVGSFLLSTISGMIFNVAVQKLSRDIRTAISEKTNRMLLNYFDTKQIGDILSVITNDVDALSTSLQNSITLAIQAVVTLVGVVIAMFISEWHMALVVPACPEPHVVDLQHILVVLGYEEPALDDILVGDQRFQRCLGLLVGYRQ